jgi:hypothetical protein
MIHHGTEVLFVVDGDRTIGVVDRKELLFVVDRG